MPSEEAKKLVAVFSKKKKFASAPVVWSSLNQKPAVNRPPDRRPLSTKLSPNSTLVPGSPRTPACASGVPGGLVVSNGGKRLPLVHHSKNSALNQTSPGG